MWHLYVVRCSDDTLYTGITLDVPRRVRQHSVGKGAKYTRSRRPVHLVVSVTVEGGLSEALRCEREVKKLSRMQKMRLCQVLTASSPLSLVKLREIVGGLCRTRRTGTFAPVTWSSSTAITASGSS